MVKKILMCCEKVLLVKVLLFKMHCSYFSIVSDKFVDGVSLDMIAILG